MTERAAARCSPVTYETDGGVAVATINRPEVRNALNSAALHALWEAFGAFDADPSAHVLVLTGAGDSAFCAGADLGELGTADSRADMPAYPLLGRNIHIDKPVIAAVNGAAYGGGFVLAQMCGLCVAAEHARFAVAEARWGRTMVGNVPLLPMIPPRAAMELFLTAEPIDAARARELGLVNRVHTAATLRSQAIAMARTIAGNVPLTVRAAKALVRESMSLNLDTLDRLAEDLFAPVFASADAREGPRAFAEGRQPRWEGR